MSEGMRELFIKAGFGAVRFDIHPFCRHEVATVRGDRTARAYNFDGTMARALDVLNAFVAETADRPAAVHLAREDWAKLYDEVMQVESVTPPPPPPPLDVYDAESGPGIAALDFTEPLAWLDTDLLCADE